MNMPTDIIPTTDFGKDIDMNDRHANTVPNHTNQQFVMAAEAIRAVVSVAFVAVMLFPAALSFVGIAAATPTAI